MALTQADIQFCNQYVRPFADKRAQAYYAAKSLLTMWNARGGATAIPNDSTAVADGSPADGRPGITGAMVNNIINRASEIVTDYEANSNAKLNTVLQVAVNPTQNT